MSTENAEVGARVQLLEFDNYELAGMLTYFMLQQGITRFDLSEAEATYLNVDEKVNHLWAEVEDNPYRIVIKIEDKESV